MGEEVKKMSEEAEKPGNENLKQFTESVKKA